MLIYYAMNKFDLVIIGAHNGSGLEQLILEKKDKVLLIEPVNYNLQSLKSNNFQLHLILKSLKRLLINTF